MKRCPLRIEIEGSCLANEGTGIARYLWEVLAAAPAAGWEGPVRIHTAGIPPHGPSPAGREGGFSRLVHHPLPKWALRWRDVAMYLFGGWWAGPADLFWGPSYVLPRGLRARATAVTVHDLSVLRHPEQFNRSVRGFAWKLAQSVAAADLVVTDSEFTRRELEALVPARPRRVEVVPLGVSPAFGRPVDPASKEAITARYRLKFPYLLAVGTVIPRKNYPRLVHAAGRIAQRLGLNLVIAGKESWGMAEVERAKEQSGLAGHIDVVGRVEEGDLPALYQHARAAIVPSLYEGFGLPALEAMAAGVPLACSRAASLPETAGEAAVYFDPEDEAGMAAAIERVWSDEALRADLAEQGRRRAGEFTWARTAARLWTLFREVAG